MKMIVWLFHVICMKIYFTQINKMQKLNCIKALARQFKRLCNLEAGGREGFLKNGRTNKLTFDYIEIYAFYMRIYDINKTEKVDMKNYMQVKDWWINPYNIFKSSLKFRKGYLKRSSSEE